MNKTTKKGQHRNFLYDVGWEIMNLRQDIEFADKCMEEPYPVSEIVSRLRGLQEILVGYADEQLSNPDPTWHLPEGDF